MGGWYDGTHGGGGGGIFGQWVSGLARYAKATGSKAARDKVGRLLDGYALTVAGDGGMLAGPAGDGAYFYDKMACGCIDAAEHAGYRGAWPLLKRVTDLVHPRLPEKALTREAQLASKMPRTNQERYTIPKHPFLARRRNGEARCNAIAQEDLTE